MSQEARDIIPSDTLQAAEAAGLSTPQLYAGRRHDPNYQPETGLGEVVMRARVEAGKDVRMSLRSGGRVIPHAEAKAMLEESDAREA